MLERYTLPPMNDLWSDATKYEIWAEVEAASAIAQNAPRKVAETLSGGFAPFDRPSVEEIETEEETTRHDVMAFVQVWRRKLDPESASWVHRNMTSSDLVDSANAVRLRYANDEIERQLHELVLAVARHALAYRNARRAARTHGQHAEASSWGYRVADITMGLRRAYVQFQDARFEAEVGKLSGPVGDYKHLSPEVESQFCRMLGINPSFTATQVVMRDGYAGLAWSLARVATVIESLALEVRLGQRTEVGELFEGISEGQRGSSAMPHKRNPVTSEQLCGLAKLVRAQVMPLLEGVALHGEQDLSHSSVERVALQTVTVLSHYMIVTAHRLVKDLVVDTRRMESNLSESQGKIQSAHYRNQLVDAGIDPDIAWGVVADASAKLASHRDDPEIELADLINDELLSLNLTPVTLSAESAAQTGHVFDRLVQLVADFDSRFLLDD